MPKRNKIVATSISNGICTTHCYSDPAQGPQQVYETVQHDMHDLPTPVILDLAAFGFASAVGSRLQRNGGFPDVPGVAKSLFSEMSTGNWKPGKREPQPQDGEPSDLAKAIAEIRSLPAHVIQHELNTRMEKRNDGAIYTNRAGRTRRFFSAARRRELEADPQVAPILVRLSQERNRASLAAAKANKSASQINTLFDVSNLDDRPDGPDAA